MDLNEFPLDPLLLDNFSVAPIPLNDLSLSPLPHNDFRLTPMPFDPHHLEYGICDMETFDRHWEEMERAQNAATFEHNVNVEHVFDDFTYLSTESPDSETSSILKSRCSCQQRHERRVPR